MVEKKKLEEKDKSDARKNAEKEAEERKKALDGQKKIQSSAHSAQTGEKAKKKGFGVSDKSISETKYGCLVAFNVEECKQLGFGKDAKTKEVSTYIKKKLGITK